MTADDRTSDFSGFRECPCCEGHAQVSADTMGRWLCGERAIERENKLLADVLVYLKTQHAAETIVLAALRKSGAPVSDNDESMKSFRKREELIARLEVPE